jgi:hypothetical protein
MSVRVRITFEGQALNEPRNRNLVEHLCATLRREIERYAATEKGVGTLNPPTAFRTEVTRTGLGAAAAGFPQQKVESYAAEAEGYWSV